MLTVIGILVGLGLIGISVAMTWVVLLVIGYWQLLKKAGEPGWKSIIPVYNNYTMYKITWKTTFFWIGLVLSCVSSALSAAVEGGNLLGVIGMLLSILVSLATLLLEMMFCVKLARSFGKGGGFAVGLFFLQPIFILILGLGDSYYIGSDL